MGLLFYFFGFLPCVRVRCRLCPHMECGVSSPRVRVHCGLYPHVECVCFSPVWACCKVSFDTVFLEEKFEGTLPSNIGMTLLGISLVLLFTLPFYISCSYSKFWQVPKQIYSIAVTQQLVFSYAVLFNFVRFALYSWPWFVISQLVCTMRSPAWCIT